MSPRVIPSHPRIEPNPAPTPVRSTEIAETTRAAPVTPTPTPKTAMTGPRCRAIATLTALHPKPGPRRGPDSIGAADVERVKPMLIAIYTFTAIYDSERVEITAGRDYVRADHKIAQRNRDAFREMNR